MIDYFDLVVGCVYPVFPVLFERVICPGALPQSIPVSFYCKERMV
jgi:hypothetical protein